MSNAKRISKKRKEIHNKTLSKITFGKLLKEVMDHFGSCISLYYYNDSVKIGEKIEFEK